MTKSEKKLKPSLTPEFLEALARVVEVVGWNVDMSESYGFYKEACRIAGVPPRDCAAVED